MDLHNILNADTVEARIFRGDSAVFAGGVLIQGGVTSTGTVTAGGFAGDLTGNVTGDLTGSATVGAGETLDVSAGTLTLADDQISGDKIDGGRIGNLIDLDTDSLHGGWGRFTDSLVVNGNAKVDGSLTTRSLVAPALRADSSLAVGGTASHYFTTALGSTATASAQIATAIGYAATASGVQSTAIGSTATASGINSIAAGYQATAAGTQSVALGQDAQVSGTYSNMAIGNGSHVSLGWGNIAIGGGTISGTSSLPTRNITLGRSTITSDGAFNVAIGDSSRISGGFTTGSMTFGPYSSVSTGYRNMAFGAYSSITGGNSNYAFGDFSSATNGWNSAAFGHYAKIESGGNNAFAFGPYSTVSAYNAANFAYQSPARFSHLAMFGSYADTTALVPSGGSAGNWIPSDPLFVVANGASDGARSNALTILKDGTTTFSDSLSVLGNASFAGELSVTDTLRTAAPALFADSVAVGGDLTVAQTLYSGNITGASTGTPLFINADVLVAMYSGSLSGVHSSVVTGATGIAGIKGTSAITLDAPKVKVDELLQLTPTPTYSALAAEDGDIWFEKVSPTAANLKIYYNGTWWTILSIP
jgi:hypothetical protein